MTQSFKLSAMLAVTGGLAAATLPATARADCSASYARQQSATEVTDAKDSGFNLEQRYKDGVAAFKDGDFRASKAAFESLMTAMPKAAPIFYLAGASRMKLEDYKGARRHLEKALKLSPDLMIAKMDLGVTYVKLNERGLAAKLLTDLETQQAACANTCASAGQLASAVETLKKAMA